MSEQEKDVSVASSASASTQTAQSSAGTQNTGSAEPEVREGERVPYDRFKQVNEAKKAAETRLKDYEAKDKQYENYAAIDKAVKEDPIFAEEINKIIRAKNEGKLTAKEANAQIKDAQTASQERQEEADPKVKNLEERLTQYETKTRQQTVNAYVENFKTLAGRDYKDEEDIKLLDEWTTKELISKYPKAADEGYSLARLEEAYNAAKDRLEGFSKRRTASYVAKKTDNLPPASKPGSSVSAIPEFGSRSDESRAVAEHLKAFRRSAE